MRTSPHIFVLCLALTGCQFTPSATTTPVTTNDAVGVWSFSEDYGNTTMIMTFMPSGVFTQQVVTASQTKTQVGRLSLDGPHLSLGGFFRSVGNPATSMHWYFIDGDNRKLEIFGGAFPDQDTYQHLSYLRPAP